MSILRFTNGGLDGVEGEHYLNCAAHPYVNHNMAYMDMTIKYTWWKTSFSRINSGSECKNTAVQAFERENP